MELLIMGHEISTFAFFVISTLAALIIILLVCVFLSLIMCFEAADVELGKFFEIVIKNLPQDDFDNLVVNGRLLKGYRHTFKSASRIIIGIVEYGEKHFSEEGRDVLNRTVPIYIDKREYWGRQKPLSIKNALQMNLIELLRRYYLFGTDHKIREESRYSRVYDILALVLLIPSIWFFIQPRRFLIVLSTISLFLEPIIRKLILKKVTPFSILTMRTIWIITFLVIVSMPLFLSRQEFLAPIQSIWFYFPLLSIVIHTVVGIWITHDAVLPTRIEKKNSGSYIANHKLLDIIEHKITPVLRTAWIWGSFFIAILGTILMYSVIYYKQLSLGSFFYCTFLSASTYFRDGNFSVNTLEGKYFLTEAIASFFINTIYIAYIIQFIFTSHKKK